MVEAMYSVCSRLIASSWSPSTTKTDAVMALSCASVQFGWLAHKTSVLACQIVATIRSKAYIDFKKRDDEIGRDAQQVLQCAEVIIKLEERMTPEEEQRALEFYPDLNLGPGLGESFIAGQELKDRYDHGESSMRAVVRAANDWRRTGFTSPIQYDDLFSLFKRHLEDLELRRTRRMRFSS
jgi:hypothetical protein